MNLCTVPSYSYNKAYTCSTKSSSGTTHLSYKPFTRSMSKTQSVIFSPKQTTLPTTGNGSTSPSAARARNLVISHPPPPHEVLSTLSPQCLLNLFSLPMLSVIIRATVIFSYKSLQSCLPLIHYPQCNLSKM